jgi:hypothetical protein
LITLPPDLLKIRRTVQAIERHVNPAGIALGLLQHLALTQAAKVWSGYHGWLRAYSSDVPSEGVVQNVVRAELFTFTRRKVPVSRTLQIIHERGRETEFDMAAARSLCLIQLSRADFPCRKRSICANVT